MAQQTTRGAGEYALIGADDRPACAYEAVLEVVKGKSAKVLTEPIENGRLAAYNKVQAPDVAKVTLSLGYEPDRQATALAQLTALKEGTSLVTLVTPDEVLDNLSVEELGTTRRASQGATLLTVEVSMIRVLAVRVVSQQAQWSPKNAGAAKPVNQGRVQPRKQSAVLNLMS